MPRIKTREELRSHLLRSGKPAASFRKGQWVTGVGGTRYRLDAAPGELDPVGAPDFTPDLSPAEMLALGVFEGKYLNDCVTEFPAEWFLVALELGKLSPEKPDPVACNLFGVKSRQPLSVWKENGWAPSRKPPPVETDRWKGVLSHFASNPDERGWFQWYCRYWMGRRIPELDRIQIARWKSFRRHAGSVRAGCRKGDLSCYPRERQALLQWAYDPFI